MSVPALPTSIGPSGSRASRRPVPRITSSSGRTSTSAPSVRTAASVDVRVGGVEEVAHAHGLGGHGAQERRAVGDRLVGGRRQLAAQAPGRLEARVHPPSPARTSKPSPARSVAARSAAGAGTHSATSPVVLSGDGDRAMSEMLMPARARVEREVGDHARAVGHAARSSRVGPPARPPPSALAGRPRRPAATCPASRRRRARAPPGPPPARPPSGRSPRPARRGWPGRSPPRAPGGPRPRAWRRESSGPSGAGRRAGSLSPARGRPATRAGWPARAGGGRRRPSGRRGSRRRSPPDGRPAR